MGGTIPGHYEEKYRAEEVKENINILRTILRRCKASKHSPPSKKPQSYGSCSIEHLRLVNRIMRDGGVRFLLNSDKKTNPPRS